MPAECGRALGAVAALAILAVSAPVTGAESFAARGEVELAFSPWDDAEQLLLRVIGGARRTVQVQAYAFTSRRVAEALVAARRRGVAVEVLADARMNRRERGNALPQLLAGGVPVALETRYAAAHNKVVIVDADGPGCALVTGSYNFTWSARRRNAENMMVLRDNCPVARAYRDNWLRHRAQAEPLTRLPWNP